MSFFLPSNWTNKFPDLLGKVFVLLAKKNKDILFLIKSKRYDWLAIPYFDNILDEIKTFIKSEKRYSELGIRYKKNCLLEGIPGTGKSSFGFAIASELGKDICIINFTRKLKNIK